MTSLAVGLVAVAGLGACTSNPSDMAVARDTVQSIGLAPDEEECMLAALDTYTDDEVTAIGEANETVDFTSDVPPEDRGDEALQKFFADLNRCTGEA